MKKIILRIWTMPKDHVYILKQDPFISGCHCILDHDLGKFIIEVNFIVADSYIEVSIFSRTVGSSFVGLMHIQIFFLLIFSLLISPGFLYKSPSRSPNLGRTYPPVVCNTSYERKSVMDANTS
jgi:hypothetical protein